MALFDNKTIFPDDIEANLFPKSQKALDNKKAF